MNMNMKKGGFTINITMMTLIQYQLTKALVVVNWNRSSRREVFCKKGVLRNFAKFTKTPVPESLYNKVACNFIKKETLVQLFSCEFCKIPNSTFSYRTPPVAASAVLGKRFLALPGTFYKVLNPLSSKLTKWSNTFKQFV